MSPHSSRAGFSLIEALIVIAVIATLSAMVLPNFLSSRATANESAVVSTLKTISTAQSSFKTRLVVDRDLDGDGEYGYLAELSGAIAPRGLAVPIEPIILGPSFRVIQNRSANKAGYMFRLALPQADGSAAPEAEMGGEDPAAPSHSESSEAVWVCYAWPRVAGSTGSRVFVINQAGDVLQTNNDGDAQAYSGDDNPPPADAAFTIPTRITSRLAVNSEGNDGGFWKALR